MRVVEQLGTVIDAFQEAHPDVNVRTVPMTVRPATPKFCPPGDYACAGLTPPWMDTGYCKTAPSCLPGFVNSGRCGMQCVSVNRATGTSTQMSSSGTEALPTDWTRFALGAVAGAAAIYILWRLK